MFFISVQYYGASVGALGVGASVRALLRLRTTVPLATHRTDEAGASAGNCEDAAELGPCGGVLGGAVRRRAPALHAARFAAALVWHASGGHLRPRLPPVTT